MGAARDTVLGMIWLSGVVAFWVGAQVASLNGYPINLGGSLAVAVVLAGCQYALIWRLPWGRILPGGLALGILPAYLGFYLQSGHWVSEVLVLGFLLSLASLQGLLAQGWQRRWSCRAEGGPAQRPDGAWGGLGYTLANILLIVGLLFVWYFPASPLPAREGAWVLVGLAVINQELIKRKYYASLRGSTILAWSSATLGLGLSLWLLLVLYLRGAA